MTTIIAELYDALREAGVRDETARAAAQAVIGLEHAATKADITELRQATRADTTELRAATHADTDALRTDIAAFRADLKAGLAELRAEVYRALWIQGGAIVAVLAGIGTILRVWP